MNAPDITDLLGSLSTSPQIADQLKLLNISESPHVKTNHLDPDGPVVEAQDWLLSPAVGIELGFEDEASWRGLDPFYFGRGPMLLTQIYFYGGRDGIARYAGDLPFGLKITDDRDEVRSRLNRFDNARRSYIRDTWDLADFRLIASYLNDGTSLDFILCAMRPLPLALEDNIGEEPKLPSIKSMVAALGKHWFDPVFRSAFAAFGFDSRLEMVLEGKTADFRRSSGFELSFTRLNAESSDSDKLVASPVLSQIVLYRDRELDSRGWNGPLPLGIRFNDGPQEVLSKVGQAPSESSDTEFAGFMLWHLPDYSLHVYYSTMDNIVLRVRLLAPGAWNRYRE